MRAGQRYLQLYPRSRTKNSIGNLRQNKGSHNLQRKTDIEGYFTTSTSQGRSSFHLDLERVQTWKLHMYLTSTSITTIIVASTEASSAQESWSLICNSEYGTTNPNPNLNPNLDLQYIDFSKGKNQSGTQPIPSAQIISSTSWQMSIEPSLRRGCVMWRWRVSL